MGSTTIRGQFPDFRFVLAQATFSCISHVEHSPMMRGLGFDRESLNFLEEQEHDQIRSRTEVTTETMNPNRHL